MSYIQQIIEKKKEIIAKYGEKAKIGLKAWCLEMDHFAFYCPIGNSKYSCRCYDICENESKKRGEKYWSL